MEGRPRIDSRPTAERDRWDDAQRLRLLGAALLVAALVIVLLAHHDTISRREHVRATGVGLARVLCRIPIERLAPRDGSLCPLEIIRSSQGHPDFAYIAVVDPEGRRLTDVASEGVMIPAARVSEEPTAWVGERTFEAAGPRPIVEYFAPVLSGSELVAQVRVGFFEPSWTGIFEHPSLMGTLALLTLGLALLSYFLMRSEIRPVVDATSRLHELMRHNRLDPVQVEAAGPLADFLASFNDLVAAADRRIRELRTEQTGLLASSKVLSYQKSRFELLLQNLPEAAVALDPSGRVTYATAKLETLLGVPVEEAMGRRPAEWCPNEAVVRFLAPYCDGTSSQPPNDTMEFATEGPSPRTVQVSVHGLIRLGGAEDAGGTLVVFRDVTPEAIARTTQAEFVGHMAHELKAPLHVLTMYVESLLSEDAREESFRVDACNVIQDELERLTELVETLLSIARLESGNVVLERQRVRLADFLSDVKQSAERLAQRAGVTLSADFPRGLPAVRVDKSLLRIALNNLATNAIKYNREKGSVKLEAQATAEGVSLRVADTGIGIEEADLSRIFEKFYRGENAMAQKQRGHGLGLALVKEIVELHGGQIEVESRPGEGSRFTIILPGSVIVTAEGA